MALCLSPAASLWSEAPATIEITSASGRIPRSPFITSLRRCGLTDSTTTSAWRTAAALSVVAWMPYLRFSCSARSRRGPAADISSGRTSFLRNVPAIIASAITPGPMNVIRFLSMPPPSGHYKHNRADHSARDGCTKPARR